MGTDKLNEDDPDTFFVVSESGPHDFADRLQECYRQGWQIVPGQCMSVVPLIATPPEQRGRDVDWDEAADQQMCRYSILIFNPSKIKLS